MLIVDTGVLVAAADRTDRHHQACARLVENEPGPFVTTALVIAETVHLIERELGAQTELLVYQAIIDETLHVESLTSTDWQRIHALVDQYDGLPLGGTDASVIAIAERLDHSRIATLDRRHFSVVRPAHCDAFELIP